MLTNRLRSLIRFVAAARSRRWLMRCGLAAGLVYTACLAGTAEAQQLQKLTSPLPDPRLLARSLSAPSAVQNAPLTQAEVFTRHSRPSATKRIYLDFDGHVTTGTPWNDQSAPTITTIPYSFEGDDTFSANELLRIQEIWERVAECYSPFDVDVTTEEPTVDDLINVGSGDTRWGVRVAIGDATPSPAPGAGGVAFLGSFGGNAGTGNDTPCFVFNMIVGKVIADAAVHEVGHTLNLKHDGRTSPPEGYYYGHGGLSPNPTGWAPNMGVGYDRNLVQWSKGEYLNANNKEDDLLKITTRSGNGFGYRPDDHANSQGSAAAIGGTAIATGGFKVVQSGVIETRTDSDWFKLVVASAGPLTLNAVGGPSNTMLDIQMDLYDASGLLVVSSNPLTDVIASISQTVAAGTYFVKIDGVGNGNPLSTGYTDYSSLGQYRITGTTPPPTPSNVTATYTDIAGIKTLTLTGDVNANVATVTFQAGTIKVEGALGTKINNSASFSRSHSGPLQLIANMGNGNDSLSMVGVDSSLTDIKLGAGADNVVLTLCKIQTLKIDGGTETDTLITTSSTIPPVGPNRVIVSVP